MTCPAVCAYTPGHVSFWFAHESKYDISLDNVTGVSVNLDGSVSRRAARLAKQCVQWILTFPDISVVGIEDYAFAATGRVFHIGENTGILKHYLDNAALSYVPYPPTVIKKFATGKGNADKFRMTSAFLADYPDATKWAAKLFPRTKPGVISAKSPLSDLADAYWIAKYQYNLTNKS
jgi:hypothetical protein